MGQHSLESAQILATRPAPPGFPSSGSTGDYLLGANRAPSLRGRASRSRSREASRPIAVDQRFDTDRHDHAQHLHLHRAAEGVEYVQRPWQDLAAAIEADQMLESSLRPRNAATRAENRRRAACRGRRQRCRSRCGRRACVVRLSGEPAIGSGMWQAPASRQAPFLARV